MDLLVELSDFIVGFVNACPMLRGVFLPTADLVLLLDLPTLFRVQFVTELAFLANRMSLHNKFHATRFTGTIFPVTVLTEIAPFPVTTGESVLIKEAHVSSLSNVLLIPSAESCHDWIEHLLWI